VQSKAEPVIRPLRLSKPPRERSIKENKIKALELENKKLDAIADILDDDDSSFTDSERIEEISELIGYDEDEDEEK
jgi:hypothetical protein